jgi:FkbM family methyltransferase
LTKGNLFAWTSSRLPWARRRAGKLSHRNALGRLETAGFAPATIYDIGAYRAGWARLAQEIFPAAAFVLFEANADHAAYLQAFGQRHFTVALSDKDGDQTFFLPRSGDVTGASLYVENTAHYAGENRVARTVPTDRLDTLVKANSLPPADLIKIDVQGAELDVIAGGTKALAHCQALIAELSFVGYNAGAPLIADAMPVIARQGFRCVDICELHRADTGGILQADFLFVKPVLFDKISARGGVG